MAIKKFYRSKYNKMFLGICGGLGEYLNIDPTIIRMLFVVIGVFSLFIPLTIFYFLAILLAPESPERLPIERNYKIKLYRSTYNRKISGICGGLSEMTRIDVSFLRLFVIFVTIFTAIIPVAIIYLSGSFIIPENNKERSLR